MSEGETGTVQFQLETIRRKIEIGGGHVQREFKVPEKKQFKQRRISFYMHRKNDSILIH